MRKLGKFLISRYTISAVMIVLEVVLMVYLFLSASSNWIVALIMAIVIDIVTLSDIINKDANPEYKITWVVVVLVIPIMGALLYAMFYRRRITRREAILLAGSFSQLNKYKDCDDTFDSISKESSQAAGKARAIMNDDPISEIYSGSATKFYAAGEELFEDLISDLRQAEHFIFLEYFIIAKGKLWDEIHGILKEKAAAGVEVRLIYDDIGCMKTLPHHYEHELRWEGIRAYRFGKVSPRLSSVHNNRDHRKICIVDGRVGYTGGVNIADEYINEKMRFGHWKDGGIQLRGDAIKGLIRMFLSVWDFTTKNISDYESYINSVKPIEDHDGGYYIPFGSGPAPVYKRPGGKNAFLNLINQAERYVYITTPYLIVDYDLTESLCNAALRGVDVRIITPGIPDKKKVNIMTKSSYPHLLEAGVRIYEYTPGFIHEKTVVCDDEYAVIGTINFDFRSLVHHYENAVWMYRTPTVYAARDSIALTVSKCDEIDAKKSRLKFSEWAVRNAIKLFAPLM